jgi:multicomponent Na+:H+ antiporter subunit F
VIVAALFAVLAACAVTALARLFVGPTLYDRALASSGLAVKASLACALLATAAAKPHWIDAALALLAAGFVANAAAMKFFRFRSFQPPITREAAERKGAAAT